jgi:hypothetical protein
LQWHVIAKSASDDSNGKTPEMRSVAEAAIQKKAAPDREPPLEGKTERKP